LKVYKSFLKFKLDELQRIKQSKKQSNKTGSSIAPSNIQITSKNQNGKNIEYFESSSFMSNPVDKKDNQNINTIIQKSNFIQNLILESNNLNTSQLKYVADDKDAQSDILHERPKSNKTELVNKIGNVRETATELNSETCSQSDDDVLTIKFKCLEIFRNGIPKRRSESTRIQK